MGVMKKILLLIFVFQMVQMQAQESSGKIYYTSKNATKNFFYIKNIPYDKATRKEKAAIEYQFPLHTKLTITKEVIIEGKKVMISEDIVVDQQFLSKQSVPRKITLDSLGIKSLRGAILFKDNTLFLNPKKIIIKQPERVKIKIDENSNFRFQNIASFSEPQGLIGTNNSIKSDKLFTTYQATLANYEHLWVPFTELTFTSLTIPLKYRFRDKEDNLEEEFSSGINLNFLLGFSYGETKFIHRDKVGNKANTWKVTGGLVLGTGTVVLNSANTSLAPSPLASGESITKGLFTFGYGATYVYNKINIGLFLGKDYSVGNKSSKWNYNKRLWLGFGVGYSLFKL